MKQVTWILEQTKFANDFDSTNRIGYLVQELGHKVVTFPYIPFGGTDYSFIKEVENPCIFYGSYGGMKNLRNYLEINKCEACPSIWYDDYNFSCLSYYEKLKPLIFQKQHEFLIFGKISKEIDRLCEKWQSDSIFLRPNLNFKSFTGNIISKKDSAIWLKYLKNYNQLEDSELCVAAKPQSIDGEWRFVVINGEVISGSQYRDGITIDIRKEYPEEAWQVAEQAAKLWQTYPVFIVDICQSKDGFFVLEIGSWNFAGLYRCDLRKIVEEINSLLLS